MNVSIKSIRAVEQRYPTCGDYFTRGDTLQILVSEEMGEDSCMLVAIHELIEAFLCRKSGIAEQLIDEFDMAYEKNRPDGDESEPGDSPIAPYHPEHSVATGIERILCAQIGMSWDRHGLNVVKGT